MHKNVAPQRMPLDSAAYRSLRARMAVSSWRPATKTLPSFGPLRKAPGTTKNKGRFEANVWLVRPEMSRGRQIYLGTCDTREEAATVHDRAARLGYGLEHYDVDELASVPRELALRRLASRAPEHRSFGISAAVQSLRLTGTPQRLRADWVPF